VVFHPEGVNRSGQMPECQMIY